MPGRSSRPVSLEFAAETAVRSGVLSADSGVGTQITMVSGAPASASIVVARKPLASMLGDVGGRDVTYMRMAGIQPGD